MNNTTGLQAPKNIAVIGLGRRGGRLAIKSIDQSPLFTLVAVCETDATAAKQFHDKRPDLACFNTVDELLEHQAKAGPGFQIDCAYVAIPHYQYEFVLPKLLRAGIHVLKEKPAGSTSRELEDFQELATTNNVRLLTAAQFRYGMHRTQLLSWLPFIGVLHFVEGTRRIDVSNLGEGWRASKALACGGALNDIGWHLLDAVLGLIGSGCNPSVSYSKLFTTRVHQGYDCEDSAHLVLELQDAANKKLQPISCNIKVSRIAIEKADEIIFSGSDGVLAARGDHIELSTLLASGKRSLRATYPKKDNFDLMLAFFARELGFKEPSPEYLAFSKQDALVTSVIDAIYKPESAPLGAPTPIKPIANGNLHNGDTSGSRLKERWSWPRITQDVAEDVQAQLYRDVSIYGNGGVFGEFETLFKQFHGRTEWHALLHNSGTNALNSLYYAAKFMPGDEVIFPVYTFHATCSPAMQFGITPIFCDMTENGNISPDAIAKAITPRTRAVVVTHMWGMPCDMVQICRVLKEYPKILLLEDCSHAHGAMVNGQMVGTFGDGAAWSLQGQKVVTGGEGGIVLTKHLDFHCRQLLWGHYNKRCKTEIPRDHPLAGYSLTGAGLKNRAHPIAISIALNQLRKLPSFAKVKRSFVSKLCSELGSIAFLEVPDLLSLQENGFEPAWYVFVMKFKPEKAPAGLTREAFVQDLIEEGLPDADIPGSTGVLHREPLFTNPEEILPHIYPPGTYHDANSTRTFETAIGFYNSIIKIPVWAYSDEDCFVNHYVTTIKTVAAKWQALAAPNGSA